MKILFVSSGNKGHISPIIIAQGKSLDSLGVSVNYFQIKGNGIQGYLKNIPKLKSHLKTNKYDVIHAHYSLTAYVCSLANAKPLIVSLMGSDVKRNRPLNLLLKIFCNCFWNAAIVKSKKMKESLGFDYSHIVPNGVDLNKYIPLDKMKSKKKLNWNMEKIHLLFAANPDREVKNYSLFAKSVENLKKTHKNIEIKFLRDVDVDKVPLYMNASDVVCLSSFREGSPNVVKEAMACNRPIVSTDVGDVSWLFQNTTGCYISKQYGIKSYSSLLKETLEFSIKYEFSNGRDRIIELGLDSKSVAENLIFIYKNVIGNEFKKAL